MTQLSSLALTQLLITRFCHDITGPIGAINNGMEVLAEDPSMQAQAMELISGSAVQAGARLQFYRYLFGMLKGEGVVDLHAKKEMIYAFYHGSRIEIHWTSCPEVIPQAQCQILCNLLLIAASTLMRGGIVDVAVTAYGENVEKMVVHASGQSIRVDEEVAHALLQYRTHTPNAKSVQAYYTALLSAEQKGHLHLATTDESATLTYSATTSN
jgi:histidine phosphotransferase ChpT